MNYRIEYEDVILADNLGSLDDVRDELHAQGISEFTPGVTIYRDGAPLSRAALDLHAELRYAEGI